MLSIDALDFQIYIQIKRLGRLKIMFIYLFCNFLKVLVMKISEVAFMASIHLQQ